MNKTLTGLAALLGAASITANANAGNFCGITPEQEMMATNIMLGQMAYSGAYECYDNFCEVDPVTEVDAEVYEENKYGIERYIDIKVMDGGMMNMTDAMALLADTVIVTRDFMEAIHYVSRGFAYKKSNPDFDLMLYMRQAGFYANMQMPIPEPCFDCYDLDEELAERYEKGFIASVVAHEAGHLHYEDYQEQICTQYMNAMFFPWDVIGNQLMSMGLSREAEFRADRYSAEFLVENKYDYAPDALLLWMKFAEALRNPW